MLTRSDKGINCSIDCKSTKTYNNQQHPFKLDKTDCDKRTTPYVYNEGDFIGGNGFILHNAYKDLGKVDLRQRRLAEEQEGYERRHTLCYFYKEEHGKKGVQSNSDKSRQGKVTELDVVVERNEGEMKTMKQDDDDDYRKELFMESKCVQTRCNKKEGIFKKKKIGKIGNSNNNKGNARNCGHKEREWKEGKGNERDWKCSNKESNDNDNYNYNCSCNDNHCLDINDIENAHKVSDDHNDDNSNKVTENENEDFIGCLYKKIRKSKHKSVNINASNYNNNNIKGTNNNNPIVNKTKLNKNLLISSTQTKSNLPIAKSFLNHEQPLPNPSDLLSPEVKPHPYRSLLEQFKQNRICHSSLRPQTPQLMITSYSSKPSSRPGPIKKNNFDNIKLLSQTEHRAEPLLTESSCSSSHRCYFLDEAEINGVKAPIDVRDLKSKFHLNTSATRNRTCLAELTKLVIDKAALRSNGAALLTPRRAETKPQIAKYNWYVVDSVIYPINNMHETALRIDNKQLYN